MQFGPKTCNIKDEDGKPLQDLNLEITVNNFVKSTTIVRDPFVTRPRGMGSR